MILRPPRPGFSVARRLSEKARQAGHRSAKATDARHAENDIPMTISSILDGLRGLATQLLDTAHAAQQVMPDADDNSATKSGTMQPGARHFRIGNKQAQAMFGYSLRVGPEGLSGERFGDQTVAPPGEPALRSPITDVSEEGDMVVVIAELPGTDTSRIQCIVTRDVLHIEATGLHHYSKSIDLPCPVVSESLQKDFTNGILEIRIRKADRP